MSQLLEMILKVDAKVGDLDNSALSLSLNSLKDLVNKMVMDVNESLAKNLMVKDIGVKQFQEIIPIFKSQIGVMNDIAKQLNISDKLAAQREKMQAEVTKIGNLMLELVDKTNNPKIQSSLSNLFTGLTSGSISTKDIKSSLTGIKSQIAKEIADQQALGKLQDDAMAKMQKEKIDTARKYYTDMDAQKANNIKLEEASKNKEFAAAVAIQKDFQMKTVTAGVQAANDFRKSEEKKFQLEEEVKKDFLMKRVKAGVDNAAAFRKNQEIDYQAQLKSSEEYVKNYQSTWSRLWNGINPNSSNAGGSKGTTGLVGVGETFGKRVGIGGEDIKKFFEIDPITENVKKLGSNLTGVYDGLVGMTISFREKFIEVFKYLSVGLAGIFTTIAASFIGFGVAFKGYINDVMHATEVMRGYNITMLGVLGSQFSVNKLMKEAFEVTSKMPLSYEQIYQGVRAMTTIAPMRAMLEDTTKVKNTTKEFFDIVMALNTLHPEQGMQGATFSLQEALAGNFMSLRRRYELPVNLLFTAEGKPLSSVKNDPAKMLDALGFNLTKLVPTSSMELVNEQFSFVMKKIEDQWLKFKMKIGESGIYDVIVKDFKDVQSFLMKFLDSDLVGKTAKRISDSMVIFYEGIKEAASGIIGIFGKIFNLDIGFNKDSFDVITNGLEKFSDTILAIGKTLNSDAVRTAIKSFVDTTIAYFKGLYEDIKKYIIKVGEALAPIKKYFDDMVKEAGDFVSNLKKELGLTNEQIGTGMLVLWLFGPGNIIQTVGSTFGSMVQISAIAFKAMAASGEVFLGVTKAIETAFGITLIGKMTIAAGMLLALYELKNKYEQTTKEELINKDTANVTKALGLNLNKSEDAKRWEQIRNAADPITMLTADEKKSFQASKNSYLETQKKNTESDLAYYSNPFSAQHQALDPSANLMDALDRISNVFKHPELLELGGIGATLARTIEKTTGVVDPALALISGVVKAHNDTYGITTSNDIGPLDQNIGQLQKWFKGSHGLKFNPEQAGIAQSMVDADKIIGSYTGREPVISSQWRPGSNDPHNSGGKEDIQLKNIDLMWLKNEDNALGFVQKMRAAGVKQMFLEQIPGGDAFNTKDMDNELKRIMTQVGGGITLGARETAKNEGNGNALHLDLDFIKLGRDVGESAGSNLSKRGGELYKITAGEMGKNFAKTAQEKARQLQLEKLGLDDPTSIKNHQRSDFDSTMASVKWADYLYKNSSKAMHESFTNQIPDSYQDSLTKFAGPEGAQVKLGYKLIEDLNNQFETVKTSRINALIALSDPTRFKDMASSERISQLETLRRENDAVIDKASKFRDKQIEEAKVISDSITKKLVNPASLKTLGIDQKSFEYDGDFKRAHDSDIAKAMENMTHSILPNDQSADEVSHMFRMMIHNIDDAKMSWDKAKKAVENYWDSVKPESHIGSNVAETVNSLIPGFLQGYTGSNFIKNAIQKRGSDYDLNQTKEMVALNAQAKAGFEKVSSIGEAASKNTEAFVVFTDKMHAMTVDIESMTPDRLDLLNKLFGQVSQMDSATSTAFFGKVQKNLEFGKTSPDDAFQFGIQSSEKSFKNWSQEMYEIGANLPKQLNTSFENNFFNAMTGKLKNLKDMFRSIGDEIMNMMYKIISQGAASTITKALFGFDQNSITPGFGGGQQASGGTGELLGSLFGKAFGIGGSNNSSSTGVVGNVISGILNVAGGGSTAGATASSGLSSLTNLFGMGSGAEAAKTMSSGFSMSNLTSALGKMVPALAATAAISYLTQPGNLFGGTLDHTSGAVSSYNGALGTQQNWINQRQNDANKYYLAGGAMNSQIGNFDFASPTISYSHSGNGITSKRTTSAEMNQDSLLASIQSYIKLVNAAAEQSSKEQTYIDNLKKSSALKSMQEEVSFKQDYVTEMKVIYDREAAATTTDFTKVNAARDSYYTATKDLATLQDQIVAEQKATASAKDAMTNVSANDITIQQTKMKADQTDLLEIQAKGGENSKEWYSGMSTLLTDQLDYTNKLSSYLKTMNDSLNQIPAIMSLPNIGQNSTVGTDLANIANMKKNIASGVNTFSDSSIKTDLSFNPASMSVKTGSIVTGNSSTGLTGIVLPDPTTITGSGYWTDASGATITADLATREIAQIKQNAIDHPEFNMNNMIPVWHPSNIKSDPISGVNVKANIVMAPVYKTSTASTDVNPTFDSIWDAGIAAQINQIQNQGKVTPPTLNNNKIMYTQNKGETDAEYTARLAALGPSSTDFDSYTTEYSPTDKTNITQDRTVLNVNPNTIPVGTGIATETNGPLKVGQPPAWSSPYDRTVLNVNPNTIPVGTGIATETNGPLKVGQPPAWSSPYDKQKVYDLIKQYNLGNDISKSTMGSDYDMNSQSAADNILSALQTLIPQRTQLDSQTNTFNFNKKFGIFGSNNLTDQAFQTMGGMQQSRNALQTQPMTIANETAIEKLNESIYGVAESFGQKIQGYINSGTMDKSVMNMGIMLSTGAEDYFNNLTQQFHQTSTESTFMGSLKGMTVESFQGVSKNINAYLSTHNSPEIQSILDDVTTKIGAAGGDTTEAVYNLTMSTLQTRLGNAQKGSDEWWAATNDLLSTMTQNATYLQTKANDTQAAMQGSLDAIQNVLDMRLADQQTSSKGDTIFLDVRKYGDTSAEVKAIADAIKANDPNAAALIKALQQKLMGGTN